MLCPKPNYVQFVASDVLHVSVAYSEVVAAVCGEVDGGFKKADWVSELFFKIINVLLFKLNRVS
jgi:hypothetical protein